MRHEIALAVFGLIGLAGCKPAPVPVEDVRLIRTLTVGAAPTSAANTYAAEESSRTTPG